METPFIYIIYSGKYSFGILNRKSYCFSSEIILVRKSIFITLELMDGNI
jgi:hypothetical protein